MNFKDVCVPRQSATGSRVLALERKLDLSRQIHSGNGEQLTDWHPEIWIPVQSNSSRLRFASPPSPTESNRRSTAESQFVSSPNSFSFLVNDPFFFLSLSLSLFIFIFFFGPFFSSLESKQPAASSRPLPKVAFIFRIPRDTWVSRILQWDLSISSPFFSPSVSVHQERGVFRPRLWKPSFLNDLSCWRLPRPSFFLLPLASSLSCRFVAQPFYLTRKKPCRFVELKTKREEKKRNYFSEIAFLPQGRK